MCKNIPQLEKPRNLIYKFKAYQGREDGFLKFEHKKEIQAHRAGKKKVI